MDVWPVEPMTRAHGVLLFLVIFGTFAVPVAYAIYRRRRPAPELSVRTACILQGLGCGMCVVGLMFLFLAFISPGVALAATLLPLGLWVAIWLGDPGPRPEETEDAAGEGEVEADRSE